MRRFRSTILVLLLVVLLGVTRWLVPERPLDYTGPRALLDAVFALGLLGLVLLLAGSLGLKVLGWLRVRRLSLLEKTVFALPLGLGIMAYGILALGLLGWLHPWAILLWLALVGVFTWREWSELVSQFPGWLLHQLRTLKNPELGEKTILLFSGLILGFSLLHALTPPWYYDSLMYHLQAPRLFLEAGRILLLPDLWQANGPFTIEMLYVLGLAWGSDSFARLLHLAYSTLLVLAVFGFGRRYLGRWEAWVAVALLVGVPILPFWAFAAYADMAWTLYGFLALYALMLWKERSKQRWLLLAGLMMGWALGSKYLALGGLGVLGLWLLWQGRHIGWKQALGSGLTFGAIALAIALPWYAKNLLWSGNPFYPFLLGGVEWDRERLDLLMAYLHSFGVGRRVIDYLLLPWNLYIQNVRFGALGAAIEIPGLLLPLALLYPFGARRRVMDAVACMAGLRFLVWAMGSQQTRFLLPLFPALALLAASALVSLARRFQTRWKGTMPLVYVIAGLAVSLTLVFQMGVFGNMLPTNVIVGRESKSEFLKHRLGNFTTLQFVQQNLSSDERALMMWNGMGYYCGTRCLPDADHLNWTRLIDSTSTPTAVATQLKERGITHLLFDEREAEYFQRHDPTGQHQRALEFFVQEFLPSCAEEVYRDSYMLLVEIDCR
jgi:hypothetical protein